MTPSASLLTFITLILVRSGESHGRRSTTGRSIRAIFPGFLGTCFGRHGGLRPQTHATSFFAHGAAADARPSNANNPVAAARVAPSLPDGRPTPLSRSDAAEIIETTLFPSSERGQRMGAGKDAQGLNAGRAVMPDDPCMEYTYGEFPLASFDELVDMAVEERHQKKLGEGDGQRPLVMVDLGSGCGRLVLYAALTRACDVHGIEIGVDLHDVAVKVLERGILAGCFSPASFSSERGEDGAPVVGLHLGAADAFTSILADTDIVFAYSTVWPVSEDWNIDLSAMILGSEWSLMLAEACRPGCVAITTDRALNPKHGWELVDRRDVENPEVFGSTGFVHVLHK